MKKTRIFALILACLMLLSAFGCSAPAAQSSEPATVSEAEYKAWAEANGYVYKPEENGYVLNPEEKGYVLNPAENGYIEMLPDIVSSATMNKAGGVNYGAIEWDDELRVAAIKEFLKGGKYLGDPSFAQDETGNNYREMYQLATSYNNVPSNTNLELVLDAKTLHLIGSSEANTGKTLEFALNPNVSVSWCRQLRVEEEEVYNYYCSYGVQINGQVKVYTAYDLQDPEKVEAILNCFDVYYPTLASTWGAYAAGFAGQTDAEAIRAAKLAYATKTLEGGSMVLYEIIPTEIIITAPFIMNMSPTMANAMRFTTVQEGDDKYAYDLGLDDAFIDKLIDYKNAYIATADGKAAVEEYYSSAMFQAIDGYAANYNMPTSKELALMTTNAAGMKTQTTYVPQ
ncbi:MAG: hypothetical protein J6I64_05780, partial [Lachnospiraceae bacterium]|nr:hypothetical protein [Lachnospiraceae bacterium]